MTTATVAPHAGRTMRVRRQASLETTGALYAFLALQAICIVASLIAPEAFPYFSAGNVSTLVRAIPMLGVIALGVGTLMIAGEFDLSVGSVSVFAAIVMAKAVEGGLNAWAGLLVAVLVGTGLGLVNGAIVVRSGLPSFIVTLGALLFWRAATLLYHGATPIAFHPQGRFLDVISGEIPLVGPYSLNATFAWYALLAGVIALLLHRHKIGNHLFAVGGNRNAAVAIGIDVDRAKLIAFGIAGACAAVAGAMATARLTSIQPGQGTGLELQAIAACVVGGLALSGGRGSILGVAIGTALIFTIQDVLLLLRAPGFYLDMFVGTLIVAAAGLNQIFRRDE